MGVIALMNKKNRESKNLEITDLLAQLEVSSPYKMHHDLQSKKITIEYYDDIFKDSLSETISEIYNSNRYVNTLLNITRVIDCYLKQAFFKTRG